MIFIDIDGTLIDFYGTAKKFGIELEINSFGKWKWGEAPYPEPKDFYAKAELQPWFRDLMMEMPSQIAFITKDYVHVKRAAIEKLSNDLGFEISRKFILAQNKSTHCFNPIDFLIDDNAAECEAWRNKGGLAYHFDLASDSPFENFLKYWRL